MPLLASGHAAGDPQSTDEPPPLPRGQGGGGFGGKNDIHTDHIAGLAALKFRKPVKFRETCREDLRYSTKRGPWVFEYRDGVKRDGRIVARHIREYHDTGAYAGMSPYATEKCGMFAAGPYGIPNILVEAKTIFTNKLIASSMRGFSILNGQSCAEVQMSKIANALGMDPWELRFVNAWRDGDLGASRYVVQGAGAIEAMKKTAELAGIELPERLMAMVHEGGERHEEERQGISCVLHPSGNKGAGDPSTPLSSSSRMARSRCWWAR